MKLSERPRPNVEAAPWVIEEVKKIEAELACANSFYKVAVSERDFERALNSNLLDTLQLAAEINPFGSVENARARDAARAAIAKAKGEQS